MRPVKRGTAILKEAGRVEVAEGTVLPVGSTYKAAVAGLRDLFGGLWVFGRLWSFEDPQDLQRDLPGEPLLQREIHLVTEVLDAQRASRIPLLLDC